MTATPRYERVVVETDGGSRGNPGPAGYGAVVLDPDTGATLIERAEHLGVTTNNVAEYAGLIAGLTAAAALGARRVAVRADSKLVVEQMSGRWQVKNPGLRSLNAEAAALVDRFDEVSFEWIPRARNAHADALANKAMDAGEFGTVDLVDILAADTAPDSQTTATAPSDTAPRSPGDAATTARPSDGTATAARPSDGTADAAPHDETAAAAPGAMAARPPGGTAVATRLILVRHAATGPSRRGVFCGAGCDPDLDAGGRRQAEALAARLAVLAPDAALVTSPQARARQTAEAIAVPLGAEPVVEPRLVEVAYGEWDGSTFEQIRAGWPDELAAWLAGTDVAPPGGESLDAAHARYAAALAAIRGRYPGRTVVVVGHGSMVKLALRDVLGAGRRFLDTIQVDPAGLSIVDMFDDGGAAVRTVNDTAHLT